MYPGCGSACAFPCRGLITGARPARTPRSRVPQRVVARRTGGQAMARRVGDPADERRDRLVVQPVEMGCRIDASDIRVVVLIDRDVHCHRRRAERRDGVACHERCAHAGERRDGSRLPRVQGYARAVDDHDREIGDLRAERSFRHRSPLGRARRRRRRTRARARPATDAIARWRVTTPSKVTGAPSTSNARWRSSWSRHHMRRG